MRLSKLLENTFVLADKVSSTLSFQSFFRAFGGRFSPNTLETQGFT